MPNNITRGATGFAYFGGNSQMSFVAFPQWQIDGQAAGTNFQDLVNGWLCSDIDIDNGPARVAVTVPATAAPGLFQGVVHGFNSQVLQFNFNVVDEDDSATHWYCIQNQLPVDLFAAHGGTPSHNPAYTDENGDPAGNPTGSGSEAYWGFGEGSFPDLFNRSAASAVQFRGGGLGATPPAPSALTPGDYWLQLDFGAGNARVANRLTIDPLDDVNIGPARFRLVGHNGDVSAGTTLYQTAAGQVETYGASGAVDTEWNFDNTSAFRYYRIVLLELYFIGSDWGAFFSKVGLWSSHAYNASVYPDNFCVSATPAETLERGYIVNAGPFASQSACAGVCGSSVGGCTLAATLKITDHGDGSYSAKAVDVSGESAPGSAVFALMLSGSALANVSQFETAPFNIAFGQTKTLSGTLADGDCEVVFLQQITNDDNDVGGGTPAVPAVPAAPTLARNCAAQTLTLTAPAFPAQATRIEIEREGTPGTTHTFESAGTWNDPGAGLASERFSRQSL